MPNKIRELLNGPHRARLVELHDEYLESLAEEVGGAHLLSVTAEDAAWQYAADELEEEQRDG